METWDTLFTGFNLATLVEDKPYGHIKEGALAIKDGIIVWLGPESGLKKLTYKATHEVKGEGGWLTPALMDCHTHLVYGGTRADEFEMRLKGKTYEEIAKAGGGIQSTVRATRTASEEALFLSAQKRLFALIEEGVSVVEIKSGYGLDLENELKMLRVARSLEEHFPVTVKTTFLGAHTIPKDFKEDPDEYVDIVCNEMLPAVHESGLADAVDGFCERVAFSYPQMERVFAKAKELGFPIKLHADQLTDSRGAHLAAEYLALSADHLEYASEEGLDAMAASGTVAVLLPGAYVFLKESRTPPVESLRNHHIPMAVATDCNPGSSPVSSLHAAMNFACLHFGLTPEEAFRGVTQHAAQALGMSRTHGTLEVGKTADLALWNVDTLSELSYMIGCSPLQRLYKRGQPITLNDYRPL